MRYSTLYTIHERTSQSVCVCGFFLFFFLLFWFKQSLFTFMKIWKIKIICMSIKQARLIVNAHKHNLLINSFCNNGYICLY